VQRDAVRSLLNHAREVARETKSEAIGWLLGFFVGDDVYVVETHPCTQYRSQSRYGAEADPSEEAALAVRYPRTVGIVGLYHSHPFSDETDHAIFHSHTDDKTLRSRASRRENYLSVVTDTSEATFFRLRKGDREEVVPDVVGSVEYPSLLRRYAARVSLQVTREVRPEGVRGLVAALESELRDRLAEATKTEPTVHEENGHPMISLPGLDGGARHSAIRITREDGGLKAEMELLLRPTVFVPEGDPDLVPTMRDEIHDDVAYLLWQALGDRIQDVGDLAYFETNLGTLRLREKRRLPVKEYRPPKRRSVLRRR
jgi:proteasome lid subunit RPN8/RPN11